MVEEGDEGGFILRSFHAEFNFFVNVLITKAVPADQEHIVGACRKCSPE
jgi:hypothetical protein